MGRRVILIGIDGGTFDIIRPLAESGELPNLKRLMDEGSSAQLTSTYPPMTFPAWPASITGMNPGKLGVSYFVKDLHNYDPRGFVTASDIKTKKIWHYLGEGGKSSVIINIPYFYPPEKINGAMVCYFNSRGAEDRVLTHPPELAGELSEMLDVGGLMRTRREFGSISEFGRHTARGQKEFWLDRLVDFHAAAVEKLKEASLYLMDRVPWDFFMVVFNSSDFLQHKLWCYMDKESPAYDAELASRYGGCVHDCYRRIDEAIGRIIEKAGAANVLVMSDHGFSALRKTFYTNQWLKEKGLLHFKGKYSASLYTVPLSRVLTKLRMMRLAYALPQRVRNAPVPVVWRKRRPFFRSVDWKRTKAYAHLNGINVNLEGREPQGCVKGEEYASHVDFIKTGLKGLSDENTGEPVVSRVFEKKEIYHGPYAEDACDVQFFFSKPSYGVSAELFGDGRLFKTVDAGDIVTGVHHSATQGVFIAWGPDISRGERIEAPHIMDITPTALHLMGLPVPEEMDGSVITGVMKKEFIAKNPISRRSGDVFNGPQDLSGSMDEEMTRKVMNSLKDLGYID